MPYQTRENKELLSNRHKLRRERHHNEVYTDEIGEEIHNLALLGLSLEQIAGAIGVGADIVTRWTLTHDGVMEHLTEGREMADGRVARSLWERATGCKVLEEEHILDPRTGEIHKVTKIKEYPPDAGACMSWLKNRQPKLWRDRQYDPITEDGIKITITELQGKE